MFNKNHPARQPENTIWEQMKDFQGMSTHNAMSLMHYGDVACCYTDIALMGTNWGAYATSP